MEREEKRKEIEKRLGPIVEFDGVKYVVPGDARLIIGLMNGRHEAIHLNMLGNYVQRGLLHPRRMTEKMNVYPLEELFAIETDFKSGRKPGSSMSDDGKKRISEKNRENWKRRKEQKNEKVADKL